MIKYNFINKSSAIIAIVGLLMTALLFIEFGQNKQLIANNRALMHDTVLKTFKAQIDAQLVDLPKSMATIENQWQTLKIDAWVVYQGNIVYPYPFKGNSNKAVSDLWQAYADRTDSGERVTALAKIEQALNDKDDERTAQASNEYFTLVENFQVSPLEEVISGLAFLQLGQKARWNNALITQLLLGGSSSLRPLSYYLFKHNSGFSSADLTLAVNIIQANLEAANIDAAWFTHNARYLTLQPQINDLSTLADFSIINQKRVYRVIGNQLGLLLSFDLPQLLSQVQVTLKNQGILAQSDNIAVSADSQQPENVTGLMFTIQRQTWTTQTQRQQWFFAVKLFLLLALVIALLLISKIITQRREKEQQTITLREQFINLVSHELKTPLAAIRIMTETLDKRASRQMSLKDYPTRIVGEVDRLWLMVDNLLSLNRIKSGEMQLQLAPTSLHQLLGRVCDKFEGQQGFSNNLPAKLSSSVDPLLFELVISNLISNGLKYNEQPQATVDFTYDERCNAILVQDNGCGINKAHWQQVFDEFYRIEQTQTQSGTGVGLSLCKLIMQLHQGDIAIVESSSAGTLWQLTLKNSDQG
ncbi:MAG: HAMP domain-containing histidine kinase [Algicola sp.]|nr:HAMP domain-containing histidine kinase [Algicola sp.]